MERFFTIYRGYDGKLYVWLGETGFRLSRWKIERV